MNCHQILTGAVNSGDHCSAVGSVQGIPFTAYAAGCNIVILASDFQRVQIIPGVCHGNIQVGCLDCSTDLGKIAAAYGKQICIYEPTPLLNETSSHRLDYRWVQTATFESDCYIHVLSWNQDGSKLLTAGEYIQMWHLSTEMDDVIQEEINFQDYDNEQSKLDFVEQSKWNCIWKCKTAQPVSLLKFSPDGTLFASVGKTDRLVKVWYESRKGIFASQIVRSSSALNDISYTFIYLAHPRAVTGLSWRKCSKYMPRESVANMLITSCRDNTCRLWVQTLLSEDGIIDIQHTETAPSNIQKHQSHRHRRGIMQQLKHIKSLSQYKRRQASQFTEDKHEIIPTLPSTYSVHDFHSFGLQGSNIIPGVHFHLAASINAETDIPLVPTMLGVSNTSEPNFVLHWLNNKEMAFTLAAEQLIQEISQKVLNDEVDLYPENSQSDVETISDNVKQIYCKTNKHKTKTSKLDYQESYDEDISKQSGSAGSSSASLATDASQSNIQPPSGDTLERKFDMLVRNWHQSPDILFSIHPIDGSLLVWFVYYLDEYNAGTFRQAQVNFSLRKVNVIPLFDAATMSHQIHIYLPHSKLNLCPTTKSSNTKETEKLDSSEHTIYGDFNESQISSKDVNKFTSISVVQNQPTPIVCMISKHNNGSFNLWHLTFGENSNFTQVLTIGHAARVCGHRFRINDITCHPVLPLLLTTSHHNLPNQGLMPVSPENQSSGSCCFSSSLPSGFCSELILWKVDAVGPLSKSGGITELARLNSPKISAFANVAWIPTLLPSTTLGGISNSPSACFVASDGHQLRVYQAVIDARTLLAEMSSAKRKKTEFDMSMSSSTSSELGYRQLSLHETFKIVSLQSAAHPGCIIELNAISDATHDWQNTQLLHIFQEQLITGNKSSLKMQVDDESQRMGLFEPDLQAVVDLRQCVVFEEPFYLVVLEKEESGDSVLHMWRISVSSQFGQEEHDPSMPLIPESNLIQEDAHSIHSSRTNSPDPGIDNIHSSLQASPLQITTTKICQQILPLPSDVEVIHATPAAGHLSSSNIYPACFAPYLLCTACSDGTVRFWKCEINTKENMKSECKKDHYANKEYTWVEWEMMLNKKSSAVQVSGQPLFVSSAYSGRVACAYKCGRSFMRPSSDNPDNRYVNLCISIFECESTGGSEWILEDTIRLKNVILPQKKVESSWDLAELVDVSVRNRKAADTLRQKLNDDFENEHGRSLQHLLSVPSYTTLQTLRHVISEQGNQCPLTQKSLVQLDWVSTEDGSHVLTVAVGSKILLFTPVSTDIAQANVQAMKASKSASRPLLKQASSMVAPLLHAEEIRWMRIRTTYLKTADGLLPLPMQISWVRDGILVVGMDNEMHIYSQWKPICDDDEPQCDEKEGEIGVDSRNLKEQELLSRAQEASQLRLPTTATGNLSRSTSYNILTAGLEGKKKRENQTKFTSPRDSVTSLGSLPDFGIFEASRLACPVLPQYHPKQLMEMLSFGKIRRVKAILNHLVRCLSGTENIKKTYLQVPESIDRESDSESGARSWSRSRALSMAAAASPNTHSPLDPQGSVSVFPEEVQLDYVEIQSIPPLPLYTLLAADNETHGSTPTSRECNKANEDYNGLFDINVPQVEETLDDILGDKHQLSVRREVRHSVHQKKSTLTQFGPRQAHLLTRLLTHSHLPGLSSLDQMHLLALADTVSSFNVAFSDHFDTETEYPQQLINKDNAVEITTDALDDCGLRYLLAVRHHTYLMRCLPLIQRAQLQQKGLGTHSIVCAFHSETQEELLQLIPSVQRGNPRWNELKEIGIGWWIRNNAVLRKIIEKVAKAAFQFKNDPLDAALFYLAMKKKNVVWGLFRSVNENKMTAFFQHNFSEDKWRKAALKNAFALLGKQRFHHAAAFFLLAGALTDAVDVCLSKLDDFQLAMVIIRLYEGDLDSNTPNLRSLLFREILGCDSNGTNYQPSCAHPDPFLRSMAHWMLQDYNGALKTLLLTDIGLSHPKSASDDIKSSSDDTTANPSVFNFYLYLRTHPLVVRRHLAQITEESRKSVKNINKKHGTSNLKLTIQGKFDDAITPLERRLFFTTAHAHFRAGCPALALEVLSRLPNHVLIDSDLSPNADIYSPTSICATVNNNKNIVHTGIINSSDISKQDFDWSQPVSSKIISDSANDFDWSTPLAFTSTKDEVLELKFDDGSEEEMGIEMKIHPEEKNENSRIEEKNNDVKDVKLDIMAQQLKFIACLKIMMEELSTLATGFEVDGGQLRYQLYIWLERSVSALRDLCNYGSSQSVTPQAETSINKSIEENELTRERLGSASFRLESSTDGQRERLPTLHEVLLSDKLDFEDKLHKATHRKQWLKANESLIRTLLGYCSLHGAHGGGLAAVRMELILFLQELQQERSQQQLLSPLPFLTTLPLLAASVASQKTVIGDPIYHLQAMTHDILLSIMEIFMPPFMTSTSYSKVCILRDLSTSLSACIYQSLCDSDNFVVKQSGGRNLAMENFISSSVVYQNSHLLAGHIRRHRFNSGEESLSPSTQPSKWPGVHSLRALMARDKDEDSPKLHTLLCEAYVATYLSQLTYALATCDCHVLYRLVSQNFNEQTWGMLFGGGAKRLLHVATAVPQIVQSSAEKESPSGESGILNSLYKQRIKLHMKLLSQLNPESSQSVIKEDRPTYREQFVSPEMSMMSCFMSKPQLSADWSMLDYDSSDSLPSDDDDFKDEDIPDDDDVFGESLTQTDKKTSVGVTNKKPKMSETIEQLDPSSYSWGILRYAIVKISYHHLLKFLSVGGIEQSDLPSISPKIHAVLKVVEKWLQVLKINMDSFGHPPPNYIPGCYVENIQKGPAILKYKQLLDLNNTPFRSHSSSLPVKRLWNYLIRQELVQDIFIRYIFPRKLPHLQHLDEIPNQELDATDISIADPIKIIHKDQDSISAFCISKHKSWIIALSTPKEIQELDISVLLEPSPWLEDEAEYDILNISQPVESLPPSDYLVVHHPADKLASGHGQSSVGGSSYSSPTGPAPSHFGSQTGRSTTMMKGHHFAGSSNPQFCQFVLERSRHMLKPIKRYKIDGVRRMCPHPVQSFYLTGSQDGSVHLWEWDRQHPLSSPRAPGTFARVTRVLFNAQGNKFGVTDGDGNLSLWQANMSCKPFFNTRCHNKQASDFIFVNSSSLIATVGHSSDNKNVCIWDTLLPEGKALVISFNCHENGGSAVLYSKQNQLLITAGKKGYVYIFDIRQNQTMHNFQAHDSAIKCMALDPIEEFFVTGAADGDIKVWSLPTCTMIYLFTGEHIRSTLFRNIGMGVTHVDVDSSGRLFSCGADGSMKLRILPDRDNVVNTIY